MVAVAGETVIDWRTTALTVSVVEPEILPELAAMVALPLATPVARPPGEVIVATLAFEEAQPTVDVMSRLLPSV
jgi:hypothetical protein